eukprot:snap_masked-scaffold_22-processed-gene-4.51-mRNA-1 protein AED:1.00 eAED:1.00 QI:0/-1/0/0/-1/1/1/0/1736
MVDEVSVVKAAVLYEEYKQIISKQEAKLKSVVYKTRNSSKLKKILKYIFHRIRMFLYYFSKERTIFITGDGISEAVTEICDSLFDYLDLLRSSTLDLVSKVVKFNKSNHRNYQWNNEDMLVYIGRAKGYFEWLYKMAGKHFEDKFSNTVMFQNNPLLIHRTLDGYKMLSRVNLQEEIENSSSTEKKRLLMEIQKTEEILSIVSKSSTQPKQGVISRDNIDMLGYSLPDVKLGPKHIDGSRKSFRERILLIKNRANHSAEAFKLQYEDLYPIETVTSQPQPFLPVARSRLSDLESRIKYYELEVSNLKGFKDCPITQAHVELQLKELERLHRIQSEMHRQRDISAAAKLQEQQDMRQLMHENLKNGLNVAKMDRTAVIYTDVTETRYNHEDFFSKGLPPMNEPESVADVKCIAICEIQRVVRSKLSRIKTKRRLYLYRKSATCIQSTFRMYYQRVIFIEMMRQNRSAVILQCMYRSYLARKKVRFILLNKKQNKLALVIQLFFRSVRSWSRMRRMRQLRGNTGFLTRAEKYTAFLSYSRYQFWDQCIETQSISESTLLARGLTLLFNMVVRIFEVSYDFDLGLQLTWSDIIKLLKEKKIIVSLVYQLSSLAKAISSFCAILAVDNVLCIQAQLSDAGIKQVTAKNNLNTKCFCLIIKFLENVINAAADYEHFVDRGKLCLKRMYQQHRQDSITFFGNVCTHLAKTEVKSVNLRNYVNQNLLTELFNKFIPQKRSFCLFIISEDIPGKDILFTNLVHFLPDMLVTKLNSCDVGITLVQNWIAAGLFSVLVITNIPYFGNAARGFADALHNIQITLSVAVDLAILVIENSLDNFRSMSSASTNFGAKINSCFSNIDDDSRFQEQWISLQRSSTANYKLLFEALYMLDGIFYPGHQEIEHKNIRQESLQSLASCFSSEESKYFFPTGSSFCTDFWLQMDFSTLCKRLKSFSLAVLSNPTNMLLAQKTYLVLKNSFISSAKWRTLAANGLDIIKSYVNFVETLCSILEIVLITELPNNQMVRYKEAKLLLCSLPESCFSERLKNYIEELSELSFASVVSKLGKLKYSTTIRSSSNGIYVLRVFTLQQSLVFVVYSQKKSAICSTRIDISDINDLLAPNISEIKSLSFRDPPRTRDELLKRIIALLHIELKDERKKISLRRKYFALSSCGIYIGKAYKYCIVRINEVEPSILGVQVYFGCKSTSLSCTLPFESFCDKIRKSTVSNHEENIISTGSMDQLSSVILQRIRVFRKHKTLHCFVSTKPTPGYEIYNGVINGFITKVYYYSVKRSTRELYISLYSTMTTKQELYYFDLAQLITQRIKSRKLRPIIDPTINGEKIKRFLSGLCSKLTDVSAFASDLIVYKGIMSVKFESQKCIMLTERVRIVYSVFHYCEKTKQFMLFTGSAFNIQLYIPKIGALRTVNTISEKQLLRIQKTKKLILRETEINWFELVANKISIKFHGMTVSGFGSYIEATVNNVLEALVTKVSKQVLVRVDDAKLKRIYTQQAHRSPNLPRFIEKENIGSNHTPIENLVTNKQEVSVESLSQEIMQEKLRRLSYNPTETCLFVVPSKQKYFVLGYYLPIVRAVDGVDKFFKHIKLRTKKSKFRKELSHLDPNLKNHEKYTRTSSWCTRNIRNREYCILTFFLDGETKLYIEQVEQSESPILDVFNFHVVAYIVKRRKYLDVKIDGRNLFEAIAGNKKLIRDSARRRLVNELLQYFCIQRQTYMDELIFCWRKRLSCI